MEKTLEDGTFAKTHLPDEWVQEIEDEKAANIGLPIAEIREEANCGACTLCGLHKCYNYLTGRLVEDDKFMMNFKPIKIQHCATREAILELDDIDDFGRSCAT